MSFEANDVYVKMTEHFHRKQFYYMHFLFFPFFSFVLFSLSFASSIEKD